jgi:dCMP deaminase
MAKRPSWDEYFMSIARQVATRATCLRRQIGAVLVLDKRILCTGYNGPPSGLPHCDQIGCLREQLNVPSGERHELCRGLHAEMNAFLQASKHGIRIDGATLYCTHHPCILCSKMLINAGVRRVVISDDYPDELSKEMLAAGGVAVDLLAPSVDR